MNVQNTQIDDLNLQLRIDIAAADYAEPLKKRLNERKRNADFKGFRKGMAPMSLIQRVYGDEALVQSVNSLVYEQLNAYINEHKLHILGEPLGAEDQPEQEWKAGNDFSFTFDLATAPELSFEVGKEDKLPYYEINITEKSRKEMKTGWLKEYGEVKESEPDADGKTKRELVPAPDTPETYERIFGKDVVKTAEEFDARVEERLKNLNKQEADYRLTRDLKAYFIRKADVALPEAFLKRWLLTANEGKVTQEDVDKEFDRFLGDFRWQLVRGYLMQKFGLKVEDADVHAAAEGYVSYQYAMYGMGNVPHEMIHEAAHRMLEDERQVNRLVEQVEDDKVLAALREAVTLQPKKISEDKFRELK